MPYNNISFEEFKKRFVDKTDDSLPICDYLPAWFSLLKEKDDEGDNYFILRMDMIFPYRLADGKIAFFEVEISNQEELQRTRNYLNICQSLLSKSLNKNLKDFDKIGKKIR